MLKIYNLFLVSLLVLVGCTNNNPSSTNPQPTNQTLVSQGDGNFGVIEFNKNQVKSFTFKNTSSVAVSVTPQIIGSGFDLVSLGCATIEPNRSCLVKVLFNANKEAGVYEAQLKVDSSVVALRAEISTVPSVAYQFYINGVDAQNIVLENLSGNNLKLMTVKVKNNSPKVGNVSTLISSSGKFTFIHSTCAGIVLKPNQSCVAKMVVKGDNSGTTLSTDLSFDNQVSALELPQVVVNLDSNLQPISSSITLGDVYQEGQNRIQLLTVENLGKSAGTINDISVPPGFQVLTNNCLNVKPGAKCFVKIAYHTSNIPTGQYENQIDLGDDAQVTVTVNQVTDPNKLDKITITSVSDALVGTCIPVAISLKDNENLDYVTSQIVNLVTNEVLHKDANCQIVDSSLAAFESSKTFYIKKTAPGNVSLQITYNSKSGQKDIFWYNELQANIDKSIIVNNQVANITAIGGKAPLTYSVLSGTGTVSSAGVYTPTVDGDVVLKVEDSLGAFVTVSVKVVNPLQLVAEKNTQMVSSTQTFSVTGGLAPLTYSIVSGGGNINATSGLFTAGTSSGNVTVKVVDSSNQTSQLTIIVATVLNINPASANVVTNQTKSFVGSGGILPYVYSVSGTGSINSVSGLFSAGGSAGSSVVTVTDAIGQTATSSVIVATPLFLTAAKQNQIVNTQQTVSGSGGILPYTYSVGSGSGTINSSGLFSASGTSGIVSLRVSDSSGQTADVSVNVVSVLAISPASSALIVGGTASFSGVGGLGPYSFAVTSGGGTITPSMGQFTASNTAGSATVRVTDALNQTADAVVTVAANITINAGNCSYAIPESVSCTVSSAGGVGTKSYSTTNGTINSAGQFKGACLNNLGSSVITVTDQYNNSAQVTLTYPCVYTSCNQIKQENYGSVSGLYWLDFDGFSYGTAPAQFYCEQSFNNGGWMLVSSNNASSSLIPGGVGRNNINYHLDRPTVLGTADPNTDYIIGSAINSAIFDQVLIVGFGATTSTNPNNSASFPDGLQTYVSATWKLSTTGSARLLEIVPKSNVTLYGTIHSSALYFILDAVKRDGQDGTYAANSDQSTVGGAGVQSSGGDPTNGTYLGHGVSEGSFEGWYHSDGGIYNAKGYTTWVKDTYYKYPRTCAEAKTRGSQNTNGVVASGNFIIDPDGYNIGVAQYQVYCDLVGNNSTLDATGGVITYDGNYKIHTFKASSNITASSTFTITQGTGSADYLVVAGGGGGGGRSGGGGGAGGLKYGTTTITLGNVGVVVGAGGSGGGGNVNGGNGLVGSNGANSQFGSAIISSGGGGGAGDVDPAQPGGSGGGGKYGGNGAAGMAGQGNSGGSGTSNSWAAGGGGGALTAGVNGAQGKCGNGGTGFTTNISGVNVTYGGGGGGGSHNPGAGFGSPCAQGLGGSGGGGNGALSNTYNNGDAGLDNFGGGGGGGSTVAGPGGNGGRGGSGIVIIKYQYKL